MIRRRPNPSELSHSLAGLGDRLLELETALRSLGDAAHYSARQLSAARRALTAPPAPERNDHP